MKTSVGRVALIPTPIQTTNPFKFKINAFYANIFYNTKHLIYANICRHRGKPTYGRLKAFRRGLFFMPILFNGALENGTLRFLNTKGIFL